MTLQNVYDVIFYKRPDAGYHNKTLYFVRDAKRHYSYVEDSKNRSGGAFSFKVYKKRPFRLEGTVLFVVRGVAGRRRRDIRT
jgi:hypothetical protein